MKEIVKIYLTVALLLMMPAYVWAQVDTSQQPDFTAIDGEIIPFTVKISPKTPKPYEEVVIDLVSFRINLDRSNISWHINNILQSSGVGDKRFSFKTGRAGSLSSVDIEVIAEGGKIFNKTIDIRPADVSLVWQAETYTPPFYKGRALPSSDATIKIIAFPNIVTSDGVRISSKNLAYRWKVGNKFDLDNSGVGKNIIHIKGAKTNSFVFVGVDVTTFDGSIKASGSMHISAGNPKLIFYEDGPLLGVKYENALNKVFNLGGNEVSIKAEPYFFSKDDSVDYQWVLNNKEIEVGADKWNSLTLTRDGDESGSAQIKLTLSTIDRVLQFDDEGLIINFGEKVSNFFGL